MYLILILLKGLGSKMKSRNNIGNDNKETILIIDQLKTELKLKKVTYQELANKLNLSEVTVKRIFSYKDCSLERLINICDILEISFIDLAAKIKNDRPKNHTLSNEQEKMFIDNFELFLFYIELINAKNPNVKSLCKSLDLTESYIIKSINKLEKYKLAELHLNDKIKILNKGELDLPKRNKLTQKILSAHMKKIAEIDTEEKESVLSLSVSSASKNGIEKILFEIKRTIDTCQMICAEDSKRYDQKNLRPVHWLFGFEKLPEEFKLKDKVLFYD